MSVLRLMVGFIASVAVYDIYCTVSLHDTLIDFEENKVAGLFLTSTTRHIIHAKHRQYVDFRTVDVSLLVTLKAAGLALSMLILQWVISAMRLKMAAAVITPVAGGMLVLLVYLLY